MGEGSEEELICCLFTQRVTEQHIVKRCTVIRQLADEQTSKKKSGSMIRSFLCFEYH